MLAGIMKMYDTILAVTSIAYLVERYKMPKEGLDPSHDLFSFLRENFTPNSPFKPKDRSGTWVYSGNSKPVGDDWKDYGDADDPD